MKKNILARGPALAAAIAVSLVFAGCAMKAKPPVSEVPAKPAAPAGTVLEYKMPAGRALTYLAKGEESQVMEIMGQSNNTQTASTGTFIFKSKGPKEKNVLLGVTLDDMAVTVTSSLQGDMSPDMAGIKGKSFDMVLSPLGIEVDTAGAEAITYSIGGETRSIASGFKTFFPDLPGKPIKVGDTWPSTSTVEEKTGSVNIKIDTQNVSTLEGFETVDGMECARISTDVTGTLTGTGNQGGMDLAFSGTIKGKDVYYFAVKDGIYVKSSSEATTQMSIDIPAASMTIPATQTSKSELNLAGNK
jgi:hypothetical protein